MQKIMKILDKTTIVENVGMQIIYNHVYSTFWNEKVRSFYGPLALNPAFQQTQSVVKSTSPPTKNAQETCTLRAWYQEEITCTVTNIALLTFLPDLSPFVSAVS